MRIPPRPRQIQRPLPTFSGSRGLALCTSLLVLGASALGACAGDTFQSIPSNGAGGAGAGAAGNPSSGGAAGGGGLAAAGGTGAIAGQAGQAGSGGPAGQAGTSAGGQAGMAGFGAAGTAGQAGGAGAAGAAGNAGSGGNAGNAGNAGSGGAGGQTVVAKYGEPCPTEGATAEDSCGQPCTCKLPMTGDAVATWDCSFQRNADCAGAVGSVCSYADSRVCACLTGKIYCSSSTGPKLCGDSCDVGSNKYLCQSPDGGTVGCDCAATEPRVWTCPGI